MEIELSGRVRQVGNSLALFIPAETRILLGLKADEEVVARLSKKRKTESMISLFGSLKGRKIKFTEGDRFDARL